MAPTLLSVEIDRLMADPTQPRKTFVKDEIERLKASIAAKGMLHPIRVIRDEERDCWVILTGESRWRAAKLAGLKVVPCLPVDGELSEADRLADRLTENMCRHDLSAIEEAAAIAKLKALKGSTSKALAAEYGFSSAAITRAEALLSLPPDVQQLVEDGRVPESAAYEISRLPDARAQLELAQTVAAGRLNRDQVADVVRAKIGKRNIRPKAARLSCKLEGGVSLTVSAAQPLTKDMLKAAAARLNQEAKKLDDVGSVPPSLAS